MQECFVVVVVVIIVDVVDNDYDDDANGMAQVLTIVARAQRIDRSLNYTFSRCIHIGV